MATSAASNPATQPVTAMVVVTAMVLQRAAGRIDGALMQTRLML
jgi:hypothetical protein